jgi:hypothetical protein
MKTFLLLLSSALLLSLLPASARAAACYSELEAEADQGIRIHSELMVIGLNCQHMGQRHGMNLYGKYREWTAQHGDLFATYEDVLMKFFKKRGDAKPEASLNTLRTAYANKISNDAAGMRPDVFCSKFAPRIDTAYNMKRDEIRKWAATIYPSHPVSYPVCSK